MESKVGEIAKLQPQEIDILLAEKVFGWVRYEGDALIELEAEARKYSSSYSPQDSQRWHNRRAWYLEGKRMACVECGDMPCFSTEAGASKKVREKLADAWCWQMFSPSGPVPRFSFGLWPKSTRLEVLVHISHAETEEMAVAVTALRSVGISVEEMK